LERGEGSVHSMLPGPSGTVIARASQNFFCQARTHFSCGRPAMLLRITARKFLVTARKFLVTAKILLPVVFRLPPSNNATHIHPYFRGIVMA
jgi:hypothetical protein